MKAAIKSLLKILWNKFLSKKTNLLFVVCFLGIGVFMRCKKTENPEQPAQYVRLKVLEYKTGKPIKGAKVVLEECTDRNYEFGGCLRYKIFRTLETDDNGEFRFGNLEPVSRISASHLLYFDETQDNWSEISLVPFVWMNVHVEKVNNYPEKSRLNLCFNNDAHGGIHGNCWPFTDMPGDTTVIRINAGNSNDYVSWSVVDSAGVVIAGSSGQTTPQLVNAFDTVKVNIQY